jgi:hypothetical protein
MIRQHTLAVADTDIGDGCRLEQTIEMRFMGYVQRAGGPIHLCEGEMGLRHIAKLNLAADILGKQHQIGEEDWQIAVRRGDEGQIPLPAEPGWPAEESPPVYWR